MDIAAVEEVIRIGKEIVETGMVEGFIVEEETVEGREEGEEEELIEVAIGDLIPIWMLKSTKILFSITIDRV